MKCQQTLIRCKLKICPDRPAVDFHQPLLLIRGHLEFEQFHPVSLGQDRIVLPLLQSEVQRLDRLWQISQVLGDPADFRVNAVEHQQQ